MAYVIQYNIIIEMRNTKYLHFCQLQINKKIKAVRLQMKVSFNVLKTN